ncbi:MAG: hypothetical protein V4729_00275 [Pseudomonadota bacterium]
MDGVNTRKIAGRRRIRLLACLPLLLAAGCAGLFDGPRPSRDEVFVHIRLVDDLPHGQFGLASCHEGVCSIRLRRETYPYCLLHELRHPFEGNFHEGRHSTEDCHVP